MLVLDRDHLFLAPDVGAAVAVQDDEPGRRQRRILRNQHIGGHPQIRRRLKREVLLDVVPPVGAPDDLGRRRNRRRRVAQTVEHACPRELLPRLQVLESGLQERQLQPRAVGLLLNERIQIADMRRVRRLRLRFAGVRRLTTGVRLRKRLLLPAIGRTAAESFSTSNHLVQHRRLGVRQRTTRSIHSTMRRL